MVIAVGNDQELF